MFRYGSRLVLHPAIVFKRLKSSDNGIISLAKLRQMKAPHSTFIDQEDLNFESMVSTNGTLYLESGGIPRRRTVVKFEDADGKSSNIDFKILEQFFKGKEVDDMLDNLPRIVKLRGKMSSTSVQEYIRDMILNSYFMDESSQSTRKHEILVQTQIEKVLKDLSNILEKRKLKFLSPKSKSKNSLPNFRHFINSRSQQSMLKRLLKKKFDNAVKDSADITCSMVYTNPTEKNNFMTIFEKKVSRIINALCKSISTNISPDLKRSHDIILDVKTSNSESVKKVFGNIIWMNANKRAALLNKAPFSSRHAKKSFAHSKYPIILKSLTVDDALASLREDDL